MSKLYVIAFAHLLACERARPSAAPQPAVAPPVDAAEVPEDGDDDASVTFEEDCKDAGSTKMAIKGVRGELTVQECKIGERSDNDTARKEGFVWDEMEGRIVWTPEGGRDPEAWVFHNWTDGWEWGWTPELVGVLVAPSGEGAILIRGRGHSPAGGWKGQSEQLDAYRIVDGELEQTNNFDGTTMTATIAPDRKTARVEWCQPAEDPDKPRAA